MLSKADLTSDNYIMRFFGLMKSRDPRMRVYVYRIRDDKLVKPALYKGQPIPDIDKYLVEQFDGGLFYIMIRRGAEALMSGRFPIEPPLSHRHPPISQRAAASSEISSREFFEDFMRRTNAFNEAMIKAMWPRSPPPKAP
jgi:hypothetical protein